MIPCASVLNARWHDIISEFDHLGIRTGYPQGHDVNTFVVRTRWEILNMHSVFKLIAMTVALRSYHCCTSPWLPSSYLHIALRLVLVPQVHLTLQHTAAIQCLSQNTQWIMLMNNHNERTKKKKKHLERGAYSSELHSRNLTLLYCIASFPAPYHLRYCEAKMARYINNYFQS